MVFLAENWLQMSEKFNFKETKQFFKKKQGWISSQIFRSVDQLICEYLRGLGDKKACREKLQVEQPFL